MSNGHVPEPEPERAARLTAEQEREIITLYCETDTPVTEIAQTYGIAATYPFKILNDNGVTWRRRDGPRQLPPEVEAMSQVRPEVYALRADLERQHAEQAALTRERDQAKQEWEAVSERLNKERATHASDVRALKDELALAQRLAQDLRAREAILQTSERVLNERLTEAQNERDGRPTGAEYDAALERVQYLEGLVQSRDERIERLEAEAHPIVGTVQMGPEWELGVQGTLTVRGETLQAALAGLDERLRVRSARLVEQDS